jgi:hypothetical protein
MDCETNEADCRGNVEDIPRLPVVGVDGDEQRASDCKLSNHPRRLLERMEAGVRKRLTLVSLYRLYQ